MFVPQKIKWKFFYQNQCSFEAPEGMRMLAPLLLSRDAPNQAYIKVLQKMMSRGFCVCVPCDETSEGLVGSFDEENIDQFLSEARYKTSTCDLKFATGPCPTNLFPTSPSEGASQAISALEHGFDIIDFCGGIGIDQKLILVKDYFRSAALPEKRSRFWGFSNGSAPMLYLGDVLQAIQSRSASDLFMDESADRDFVISKMIEENRAEDFVEKTLLPLNDFAKIKYSSQAIGESIKFYAVNAEALLHNLDSEEEWSPPLGEKFILSIEGISGATGFSPHEALEKFLAKYPPDQIQHIELGEIVTLKSIGMAQIDGQLVSPNEELNAEILAEQAAIKAICDHYGVALVAKEGTRTGHGSHVDLDPSDMPCSIFSSIAEDGALRLTQRTNLFNLSTPQKPSDKKPMNNLSIKPRWQLDSTERPKFLSEESYNPHCDPTPTTRNFDLEVIAMNSEAHEMLQGGAITHEVVGGKMYNAIELDLNLEKGLFLVHGAYGRNGAFLQIQDATMRGRMGKSNISTGALDLPFVIIGHNLSPEIPVEKAQDFIKWNQALLVKFIELNQLHQTPIFYIREPLAIDCDLFAGLVNLRSKTPVTEIQTSEPSTQQGKSSSHFHA